MDSAYDLLYQVVGRLAIDRGPDAALSEYLLADNGYDTDPFLGNEGLGLVVLLGDALPTGADQEGCAHDQKHLWGILNAAKYGRTNALAER